jgi:hypothetical protein
MTNEDAFGTDQDVLDDEPENLLAFRNRGGLRGVLEPAQETLQAFRELEVAGLVGQPSSDGVQLGTHARLFGAQRGHALAQLVK